ncbi:hypothetical protein [Clostridium perfringens]|uniref:hypothetical protein n=1 Tax=Clostridium perfringens TaxID=1502 RepID=UPI003D352FEC
MKQEEVLKKVVYGVKMPKRFKIGDEWYFEEYANDKKELDRLTYVRGVRGKSDWQCKIVLEEKQCEDFQYVSVHGIFAEDEAYLKLLDMNKMYKGDKVIKDFILGVDTASYLFEIDNNYSKVRTGADGYFGYIREFSSNKNKLRAIELDLDFGDDFERARSILEGVFEIKEIKEIK